MNCKPGDLAIVVHTTRGEQVGRIVRCVDLVRGLRFADIGTLDAWITEPMLMNRFGEAPCPDAWLRPIRPGDISDEEVRDLYLPKPPEKQPA